LRAYIFYSYPFITINNNILNCFTENMVFCEYYKYTSNVGHYRNPSKFDGVKHNNYARIISFSLMWKWLFCINFSTALQIELKKKIIFTLVRTWGGFKLNSMDIFCLNFELSLSDQVTSSGLQVNYCFLHPVWTDHEVQKNPEITEIRWKQHAWLKN